MFVSIAFAGPFNSTNSNGASSPGGFTFTSLNRAMSLSMTSNFAGRMMVESG